ncbi:hypothetical protein H4582DRAFT_1258272 [Lactarius indigo]|nr:hypothetical protein H4582DRAFT_1258272 [Lactarius indigo]
MATTTHRTPHRGLPRWRNTLSSNAHDSWTATRLRGQPPNAERRRTLYHSIYLINTIPLSNVTVHGLSQHLLPVHIYFIHSICHRLFVPSPDHLSFTAFLHITFLPLTPLLVSPSLAVLHLVHTMQISTGYCTLEYRSYSRHISIIIALPTYERYCIISPPPTSVFWRVQGDIRSIPSRPSQGKSSAALCWSSTIRQMPHLS